MGVLRMVYLQILGDFCNLVWCFCKIGFWKMRVKALSEPPYWETSVFSTFTFLAVCLFHMTQIFFRNKQYPQDPACYQFPFLLWYYSSLFFFSQQDNSKIKGRLRLSVHPGIPCAFYQVVVKQAAFPMLSSDASFSRI